MTRSPFMISRRSVPGVLTLALAGCAGLFVSPPPKYIFRLTPNSNYPPNLPHIAAQLLIDVPTAPAALDRRRIALTRSPVSLDYFADSEWADNLSALVQTALLTSFENSGTMTALGREGSGLRADFILTSEIRHFEAEYAAGGSAPTVWVSIEVMLVAMPRRDIVAQALFERHIPASADALPDIVAAFDAALGAVMREIVVWTVTNSALSAKRPRVL